MSSQCWTSSIYQPVQYQFLSLLWLWVSLVTKINPPNHGGDPFISVGSAGMAHLSTTSTTSSTGTDEMQENLRISTLYNAGLRWYHSNHDPGMDWVWFKNFRALDIWNLDLLRQIWCIYSTLQVKFARWNGSKFLVFWVGEEGPNCTAYSDSCFLQFSVEDQPGDTSIWHGLCWLKTELCRIVRLMIWPPICFEQPVNRKSRYYLMNKHFLAIT